MARKPTQQQLEQMRPIDRLAPKTAEHEKLLKYLKDRLELSERKMSDFYPRWRVNERKVQAYVQLTDYQKILDRDNKDGKPPKPVTIIVPYSYAVIQTVVTYLLHTFCGRQPIFQVSSYSGEKAMAARNLEILMQYNADKTKLILQIYNMLMSAQVYQIGVLRVGWREEQHMRTRQTQVPTFNWLGLQTGAQAVTERVPTLIYSGNEVSHIDPFLFFPDPRVPMTEVNRKGEFVFWRSFENRMNLKIKENGGSFKWVDAAPKRMPHNESGGNQNSDRALRSQGDGIAGEMIGQERETAEPTYQVDEGTCVLIPAEWGLGESRVPEKWIFTILNKAQIVRAEPFETDHELHPVAVIEPNAIAAQFGSMAMADIVGPVQDHISWLINSHMQNVRGAINNRLVVNPHYVHLEDFKKDPADGEDGSFLVRMKQSAFGMKPSDGLYQLQVADVTQNHIKNVELMIRIGHMFAGVNENLMGLQDSKGRKTATEVRTSGEAGASRLAAMARLISAQGLSDLPLMMAMNLQQRLNPEFYNRVLGEKALGAPLTGPDQISGDFNYPLNDGTLPLDRAALLGVWQQILLGVAQDAELRSTYSLPKLFAYVADLGGARNIDQFKTVVMPDAAVEANLAAGNIAPLPGAPQQAA